MPRSWRSLLAWQRNFVQGEGGPEPDETIWCIIQAMRTADRTEEADALILAHDCYLRSDELMMIRVADISVVEQASGPDVVVRLGEPSRQERTKTGPRQ